jgi:peptidoglycan/LPS O-acetylase OafA/YrhL
MKSRFEVLDGWRGISIVAVLACHELPLGPKRWQLNLAAGHFGMAIFFCLSGFLITNFLLHRPSVRDFLIRRLCRILPLAWLALPIAFAISRPPRIDYLPNLLFFANFPPFWLVEHAAHFWSLCVEVQFYATIALVFVAAGKRGLLIGLPVGVAVITALHIASGQYDTIVTWKRADEILAGGVLALIHTGEFGSKIRAFIGELNPVGMLTLFTASCQEWSGPLYFARPYLAAALVGSTLLRERSVLSPLLRSRVLAYVAEISYALYVWHPLVEATWLGTGRTLVKYLKRPLLIAVTLAVAHISTFYYERWWIDWGKRLSNHTPAPDAATRRIVQS